jgi:hypothetical protein
MSRAIESFPKGAAGAVGDGCNWLGVVSASMGSKQSRRHAAMHHVLITPLMMRDLWFTACRLVHTRVSSLASRENRALSGTAQEVSRLCRKV